jgi:hypothetical protein
MTYKNFFSVFFALPLACVSNRKHPQVDTVIQEANANVDTNDYSYPIKDLINERDSFRLHITKDIGIKLLTSLI